MSYNTFSDFELSSYSFNGTKLVFSASADYVEPYYDE